jgi:hypothetical protein
LEVRKEGYVDALDHVTPDTDQRVRLTLVKSAAGASPQASAPGLYRFD